MTYIWLLTIIVTVSLSGLPEARVRDRDRVRVRTNFGLGLGLGSGFGGPFRMCPAGVGGEVTPGGTLLIALQCRTAQRRGSRAEWG